MFTAQTFMKIEVPEYIEDTSSSHRPTSQQQTHLTHHNDNESDEQHLACVDEDEDNQVGPEETTYNIDDQDSDMELMYTTGHESEIGTLYRSPFSLFI